MSVQILDISDYHCVSGFIEPDLDEPFGLRQAGGHDSLHITAEVWP